jgi:glycosyltransferase involved in cell wall biosynthesis
MGSGAAIVMLGTTPGAPSGIASVVQAYAAHGLFQRWDAVYLPTHRNGNAVDKLAIGSGAWVELLSRLAMGRVALLHIHLASYASFWRKAFFMLPAGALRVPYVLHLHGGAFLEFYRAQAMPAQRIIRDRLRGAARVIALSDEWRASLAEIEPAARIVVIPNPVDIPAWQANLDTSPPSVLFLGAMLERKGVADLLRAWPTVLEALPGAQLALAGDGAGHWVDRLIRELAIEDAVRIEGRVAADMRDRLLRRAWALALPSHVEALPVAILEALAAGVPVVATRVGGIPAAVEHGRNGFLVAPRDVTALSGALISVLRDATVRKALGVAARARAIAEFSSEVTVPRIEAVWRELAPEQEIRVRAPAA